MYQSLFEQMNLSSFSKPFMQLGQLTLNTAQDVNQQTIGAINELVNLNARHMQNCMNIKKPEDMINLQTNFLNEYTNKLISNIQQSFETSQNIYAELNKIMQSHFKSTSEETGKSKSVK